MVAETLPWEEWRLVLEDILGHADAAELPQFALHIDAALNEVYAALGKERSVEY
jgi:hypothetical protein